jgi:hypothetical protein
MHTGVGVRRAQTGADTVAADVARDDPGPAYGQGSPQNVAEAADKRSPVITTCR